MNKIESQLKDKSVKPTAMRLLVLQFFTEQTKAVSLKDLKNLTKIYENILQNYFK